jgi:molybdate transport system substrate-binding protein
MKKLFTLVYIALGVLTSVAEKSAALQIFAAAGTAPAMKEIAQHYTKTTGIPVVFNFANSGILAKQIAAGASFDLFFSANEKWLNYADDQGFINPATRVTLLKNELVIVVPKGASTDINLSAPKVDRFAIGDQATPVGIYAKQAFTKLGCWNALQPHLCVGDTVNKVLNYVALGEADAGVVFRSVAFCAADRVDIVQALPPELHDPIRFPIAAARSASPEAAQFLEFIQSSEARALFEKYGWNRYETDGSK